jgi:hypothetical protein
MQNPYNANAIWHDPVKDNVLFMSQAPQTLTDFVSWPPQLGLVN